MTIYKYSDCYFYNRLLQTSLAVVLGNSQCSEDSNLHKTCYFYFSTNFQLNHGLYACLIWCDPRLSLMMSTLKSRLDTGCISWR